ncbi:MAG TPA: FAD-dependent oxidoreductase, partial [Solirubrobacterales bacterium]
MTGRAPTVGVVGGGVLGTSLALRLAQAGAAVTVIERGLSLGGLAGTIDFGGHQVDRFYHVITPADQRMMAMAEEV